MLPRRFSDLSAFGQAIIVAVAVITLAITAVAFAASYNALYRLFDSLGLYGRWITLAIPLLLDAAFIGGELAGILAGILRAVTGSRDVRKGWPVTVVLICGTLTIALNVVHAYLLDPHAGPLTFWRCLAASLPPVLMMLAFQVDVAIVRWVMIALGRPLTSIDAPAVLGVQPVHPQMQMPSVPGSRMGQIGPWGSGAGGGEATKRHAIETVAAQLGTEEVTAIGPEGVAVYLAEHHGVQTTPGYVRKVLEGRVGTPSPNGKGHP